MKELHQELYLQILRSFRRATTKQELYGRNRYYALLNLTSFSQPTHYWTRTQEGTQSRIKVKHAEDIVYGFENHIPFWAQTAYLADVNLQKEYRDKRLSRTLLEEGLGQLRIDYIRLRDYGEIPLCAVTAADNIPMQRGFMHSFPDAEIVTYASRQIFELDPTTSNDTTPIEVSPNYSLTSIFNINTTTLDDLKHRPDAKIADAVEIRHNDSLTGLVLNSVALPKQPEPVTGQSVLILSPDASIQEVLQTLSLFAPIRKSMRWGNVILPIPNPNLKQLNEEDLHNLLGSAGFSSNRESVLLRSHIRHPSHFIRATLP